MRTAFDLYRVWALRGCGRCDRAAISRAFVAVGGRAAEQCRARGGTGYGWVFVDRHAGRGRSFRWAAIYGASDECGTDAGTTSDPGTFCACEWGSLGDDK